jgi:hypothetical protein
MCIDKEGSLRLCKLFDAIAPDACPHGKPIDQLSKYISSCNVAREDLVKERKGVDYMTTGATAWLGAQKQWNVGHRAELRGEKQSVAYFHAAAADYYHQQGWMYECCHLDQFSDKHVLAIRNGPRIQIIRLEMVDAISQGVDTTETFLKLATLNATLQDYKVEPHDTDATHSQFEVGLIDCVCSFGFQRYSSEIHQISQEIRRMLKLDETVMIALYHRWSAIHIPSKIFECSLHSGCLFTNIYYWLLLAIKMYAHGAMIEYDICLFIREKLSHLIFDFCKDDLSIRKMEKNHFWLRYVSQEPQPFLRKSAEQIGCYVCFNGTKQSSTETTK